MAGVVRHGDLDDAGAAGFELADELDTDGSAGGLQVGALEEGSADEAEVAIDVAKADAEQEAGELVIAGADDDAVPRVLTADLVAVDEADIGPNGVEEFGQFTDIVLTVAIGVEDKLLGGGGEAGAEGAAIAAILRVRNDAEPGAVHIAKGLEDFAGIVGTAVVDDDDFEIRGAAIEDVEGAIDERGKGGGVVVGGEEDAQAVREGRRC